jgi:putative hydrolase of the HAD superfamily
MSFKFILFDLDHTLYPPGSGLFSEVGQRIQAWLCNHMGLAWDEALAMRSDYFGRYGTTLGGLVAEHEVDAHGFLTFVHDVPVEEYVAPNPALAAMLKALPLRRVVYTNGTVEYAWRVLHVLGVADCFEHVIGIDSVGLRSKFYRQAYERALALLGAQGSECIMVEDSIRNLCPAKDLGLTTVLVRAEKPSPLPSALPSPQSHEIPGATVDFVVKDVLAVGSLVQRLVEDKAR